MRRLAVFFPGIGYTADKPLLYYSRRLAERAGYELGVLGYSGFPKKLRGDRERLLESIRIACRQSRKALGERELEQYGEILFVGKSIGTAAAAELAAESPVRERIRLLLYTPLEETFAAPFSRALVFTGAADPWVGGADSRIPALCRERGVPCVVIPNANHSLESGDPLADIRALEGVMAESARFMA